MTKGVFSWYNDQLRICTTSGFPACSEIETQDGSWLFLKAPEDPQTQEEKALALLAQKVNEDFQNRASEILGKFDNVILPGAPEDLEKLELRLLLHNDGFHLTLARNQCSGAPAVDLEKVIKTGQKALQEEGIQAVITT